MSQSESQPSGSESNETQEIGVCKQLLCFNEHGQPIGEGSSKFSTFVGRVVRANCPPTYITWRDVPISIKEQIWSIVLDTYDVPIIHKGMVLSKANVSWKQWKHDLRVHFDKYQTNVERKINVPKRVKREDWKTFVDICSTEQERARREKGKSSREKMKSPHTTGRRGAANTAEELKKQNPNATVTRTHIYLASHTKKDGTCPFPIMSEQIDEIKRIISTDPYVGERDIDNDPVAKVCGRDGRGSVRGMGRGVSKTAIQASAPSREIAQREKRARESIESMFDIIVQRLDEECRARRGFEEKLNLLSDQVLSQGTHMSDSADQFSCSSQVRLHSSIHLDSLVGQSSTRCLLKNFKKKVVALGRVNREATTSSKSYSIRVDDIYETQAELYASEGTLGDVTVGDTISWPKGLVDFI